MAPPTLEIGYTAYYAPDQSQSEATGNGAHVEVVSPRRSDDSNAAASDEDSRSGEEARVGINKAKPIGKLHNWLL
jgi:hypothetical protein